MAAVFNHIRLFRPFLRNNSVLSLLAREIHGSRNRYCTNQPPDGGDNVPAGILSKYEPFKDNRSPIIMDVEEERRKIEQDFEENVEEYSEFEGISSECGVHGVLDIEELVDILRRENAVDLCVIRVPPEYRYVQYMVIVSGKSAKHMLGMAEFVRKVYKYKNKSKEVIPTLEGKGSRDWIALDLGNIALHVFSKTKRQYYDLESLWSIGSQLDRICNAPEDPVIQMLQQHSIPIGDSPEHINQ